MKEEIIGILAIGSFFLMIKLLDPPRELELPKGIPPIECLSDSGRFDTTNKQQKKVLEKINRSLREQVEEFNGLSCQINRAELFTRSLFIIFMTIFAVLLYILYIYFKGKK